MLPAPDEPKFSLPGWSRAYCTSSASEWTGTPGCTTTTSGTLTTEVMNARSLRGSYGILLMVKGAIATEDPLLRATVYPSAGAFAAASPPMTPPPPPRFSTTTVCPRFADMPCARTLPKMSDGPPAGNGTMSRSGLEGKLCASAGEAAPAAAVSASMHRRAKLSAKPIFRACPVPGARYVDCLIAHVSCRPTHASSRPHRDGGAAGRGSLASAPRHGKYPVSFLSGSCGGKHTMNVRTAVSSDAEAPAAIPVAGLAVKRWVQLLLGVICMMSISSPQYVWTLFTRPLTAKLGVTLAAVQWTFSLLIVLQTFLSPLQGYLIDRFGPKVLLG